MTPERIAEITSLTRASAENGSVLLSVERAIRQAVNEALEEAAKKCTDLSGSYEGEEYDLVTMTFSDSVNAIRALKLPEE